MSNNTNNLEDTKAASGFAKRAKNFEAVINSAILFKENDEISNISFHEIHRALSMQTCGLTVLERSVLMFYVGFLNLSSGNAYIWPCNRFTEQQLELSDTTLRRAKKGLEEKGFLLRNYDMRNRHAEKKAIDLSPLLSRVPSLLDDLDQSFENQQLYWKKGKESRLDLTPSNMTGYPGENDWLNTSNSTTSVEVQGISKNVDKEILETSSESDQQQSLSESHPALHSAKTLGEGLKSQTTRAPSINLEKAKELIELSPALSNYFEAMADNFWKEATEYSLWTVLDKSIKTLLPKLYNSDRCWDRAKARYGDKALELLVVAIEDKQIRSPAVFVNNMVWKWKSELVMGPNLKRIRDNILPQKQAEETKDAAADIRSKHPVLAALSIESSSLVSWFATAELKEIDGELVVSVSDSFKKSRIEQDFKSDLSQISKLPVKIVSRR